MFQNLKTSQNFNIHNNFILHKGVYTLHSVWKVYGVQCSGQLDEMSSASCRLQTIYLHINRSLIVHGVCCCLSLLHHLVRRWTRYFYREHGQKIYHFKLKMCRKQPWSPQAEKKYANTSLQSSRTVSLGTQVRPYIFQIFHKPVVYNNVIAHVFWKTFILHNLLKISS